MKKLIHFLQNKKIDLLLLAILFLLIGYIYRGWFAPGMIAKGDLRSWSKVALEEFISTPPAWFTYEGGGYYYLANGFQLIHYPFLIFQGIMAKIFNTDFALVERLTLFFPFIILSILGVYLLADYIFKNKTISFFATLAYLLNPLTLLFAYVSHFVNMLFSYALLPFILLFYLKALNEKQIKRKLQYSILTGLIFSLVLYSDIRMAYLMIVLILGLFTYYFIIDLLKKNVNKWKNLIKQSSLLGIIFGIIFLLNLYWLIPLIFAPPINGIIQTADFNIDKIDKTFSLLNALLLKITEFNLTYIPLFITTIITLSALFFFKKTSAKQKMLLTFFFLWFFIAVFLHKSGAQPLPEIFVWLYKHLPGFQAFRNPNKIAFASILPWSLLFGFAVFSLTKLIEKFIEKFKFKFKKIQLPILIKSLIFVSIILLLFANLSWLIKNYPIGDSASNIKHLSTFKPEQVSVENHQMEQFFNNDENKFRMLYFPTDPAYGILNKKHTAIYSPDLDPSNSEFLRYLLSWRWYISGPFAMNKINRLGKLLTLRNIKYINYLPSSDIFFESIDNANEEKVAKELLISLEHQKDLEKIDIGENINIFLNKSFQDNNDIFLTTDSYLINGGLSTIVALSELPLDFNNSILFSAFQFKDQLFELENKIKIEKIINFQKNESDLLLTTLDSKYFIDPWQYTQEITLENFKDKNKKGFFKQYENRPTLANTYGEIRLNPNGLVKGLNGSLAFPFRPNTFGEYEIWLRFGLSDNKDINYEPKIQGINSLFNFKINNQEINPDDFQLNYPNNLEWLKIFNYNFQEKDNHFEMFYQGQKYAVIIDQFAFVPIQKIKEHKRAIDNFLKNKKIATISLAPAQVIDEDEEQIKYNISPTNFLDIDKAKSKQNNSSLQVKEINTSYYQISFTTNSPVYLVFRDNYDPYWQLTLNNKKYQPIKTMAENNSFYIDKPGNYTGKLEFTPQKYVNLGFILTIINWLILIIILLSLNFISRKKHD